MPDLRWTNNRVYQLSELVQLVRIAGNLNKGSGVTQNIKRCEEIAYYLNNFGSAVNDLDFMSFLNELAIADREKRHAADTTDA